jgi:nucleotidyltransferase substrate binding protein (TIGR01987 family)
MEAAFSNFEKSLQLLVYAMNIKQPDVTQKAGLIQFFEMSFELSWKTLKDYLEEQGFTGINAPRAAIKKGFETNLVADGHLWLQLLEDRNLTTHAYDEEAVTQIETLIHKKYFQLLQQLYLILKEKLDE